MPLTITAAVARGHGPFCLEQLQLRDPLPTEILVRYDATGLCHTDLEAAAGHLPTPLPAVLGHEGAGTVEYAGAATTGFRPGDRVILSLASCQNCTNCSTGLPMYCNQSQALNLDARRPNGPPAVHDSDGKPVHDHFFGQSSLASHGLAHPACLVKTDEDLPAELLAPLGCSLITGAGAVFNTLHLPPGASVAIFGPGAVGCAALLAAATAGAARIAVVGRRPERLTLAGELGATDIVDSTRTDSLDELLHLTQGHGWDFTIECTGALEYIRTAIAALAPRGTVALLGIAPPGHHLLADTFALLQGRTITGSIMGHQTPAVLIPRLLALRARGRFPYDRLIQTYPLTHINTAAAHVSSGATVKAVLQHRHPQPADQR